MSENCEISNESLKILVDKAITNEQTEAYSAAGWGEYDTPSLFG